MPTGDSYCSGHLIPSYLGLAYVLLVETNPFPELVVIFPDYTLRTSLGSFSILLCHRKLQSYGKFRKLYRHFTIRLIRIYSQEKRESYDKQP